MKKERIHKVLSSLGLGSRRNIEQIIREGRILVNQEKAILGQSIDTFDKVSIDGKKIQIGRSQIATRMIAFNKKVGQVTSRKDPEGRPTIFDSLPKIKQGRWVSIGRLDINTSGLILLTNNGVLANKMMHPSSRIEREYVARIHGKVKPEHIKRLLEGVDLKDGYASFSDIQAGRKGKTKKNLRKKQGHKRTCKDTIFQ